MAPPKADPDPKAVACYGLRRAATQAGRVRFVAGRPVSHVTTAFLGWVGERLNAEGKAALLVIWGNARWHLSQEGHAWLRQRNRQATCTGAVRILVCRLPIKRPGWNRIEPQGVHAKRAVVDPDRLLTKAELIERIGAYFNGQYLEPLHQIMAQKVAGNCISPLLPNWT